MGKLRIVIVIALFISLGNAQAETMFQDLGNGWTAFTKQADPFDNSKVEVIHISKESFIFRCNELNMVAPSYGFEGLSFNASLKYIVDTNSAVDKSGGFATYLGGSDLVTDSRYYHFKLSESDLNAFKKGNAVKVAGNHSNTGWITKSLSLRGFTKAYDTMCS